MPDPVPRKFSEEQITTSLADTDIMPLTRDPLGTPVSWVIPVANLRQQLLAGVDYAPLVPVAASDVGAAELPNGGTVVAATVTTVAGNTTGNIDDSLLISITNPVPPMAGPLVVRFPITLGGAIPSRARLRLMHTPGAVPVDFSSGIGFGVAGNDPSLALFLARYAVPGPTYTVNLAEISSTSGAPASWDSDALTYALGEILDISLRKVTPFAASPLVPQVEVQVNGWTFATPGELFSAVFAPISANMGTFNDAADWDGSDITDLSLLCILGAAYVGTLTYTIQLSKNF